MATKKRKSTKRRTAARRKKAEQRLPAGLGTLFGGLLLMVLAFVQGDSVWRVLHDVLFGLFGCGSFVLGAAVCYLAILYTRGQDLLMQVFKLLLGLIFASDTVIVFSDIPADLTAAQMIAACYQNGANAWLGGGVLGTLLGGNLLLLCGRPAANLVMAVLALCASLYIFDITPAECWQWLCNVGGGVHEKGVAVYEQNAARHAERLAARQAEEECRAEEPADDYDDNFDEEDVPGGIPVPGWLSGVFSWGHKVTKEMEDEAEPAPVDDSLGYEPPAPVEPEPAPAQPAPAFEPVKVTSNHPRAAFDIDLGPDTSVSEGGSEPIEPIIIGPGGTFGQDPLQKAPPRAIVKPVVPDAVETAAEDFFAPAGSPAPAPVVNPTVPPAAPEAPAAAPAEPVQPEMPVFQTPTLPTTDEPVVPVRVSAENAVAMRDAGCTLDEAVTWLEAEKITNQIFFTVGNLDYLIKGGRIGKVTGRAANILGIKPMILFKEGEIFSAGVARGRQKSFEKALDLLMTYLAEHNGTPDDYCITVGYGYDADEGKRLWMQTRAALRAKYPTCECNVVLLQIGCTIAVHTGPYALGMGVMRRWKKQ